MNSYVLTTRGRVIIGVLVLLLLTGLFLGVGSLLDGNPPEESTSPDMAGTQPPESPVSGGSQTPDVSIAEPSDAQTPDVSATDAAVTEPPASNTPPAQSPGSTATPDGANTPEPTEPPSQLHTPDGAEKWYLSGATLVFENNSADLVDEEQSKQDLRAMLPADLNELRGYVILVKGFKEPEEDAPKLADLRAETVSRLLVSLGVPESSIRTNATEASGVYATKRRAEVSFLEVGDK